MSTINEQMQQAYQCRNPGKSKEHGFPNTISLSKNQYQRTYVTLLWQSNSPGNSCGRKNSNQSLKTTPILQILLRLNSNTGCYHYHTRLRCTTLRPCLRVKSMLSFAAYGKAESKAVTCTTMFSFSRKIHL